MTNNYYNTALHNAAKRYKAGRGTPNNNNFVGKRFARQAIDYPQQQHNGWEKNAWIDRMAKRSKLIFDENSKPVNKNNKKNKKKGFFSRLFGR